jgi:myo-inositol-1(or 4)-monophosphatase
MNDTELFKLYLFSQKIICEAGKHVEKLKKNGFKVLVKQENELVSEIDIYVQKFLTKRIRDKYQSDIYDEEYRGVLKKMNLRDCFIIDPIDASHNLIAGLPFYNISIGYVYKNIIIFGIIYFPYSGEMYHAFLGKGAYKDNNKISVSKNLHINKSIIAYDNKFTDKSLKNYINLVDNVFTTRILGSANRDACYVAEGVLDARIWNHTKVFDVVAGMIIVSEAGGISSNFNGENINLNQVNDVIMASKGVHSSLINLLN